MTRDPHRGARRLAAARPCATVLELLAEERASVSSVVDERAWKVHVADSLTGLEVPSWTTARRIADVGAGAGFPGLVLAVALPGAEVDLIESVGRKCDFMQPAPSTRPGSPTPPSSTPAPRTWPAAEGRESYDVVTARAVGRLSTLAELASPLLKPNGVLVAWKGKRDEEEERQLDQRRRVPGHAPEQILDVGDRGRQPSTATSTSSARSARRPETSRDGPESPRSAPRAIGRCSLEREGRRCRGSRWEPAKPPSCRAGGPHQDPPHAPTVASSFFSAVAEAVSPPLLPRAPLGLRSGIGISFWIVNCWPIVQMLVVIQ